MMLTSNYSEYRQDKQEIYTQWHKKALLKNRFFNNIPLVHFVKNLIFGKNNVDHR